TFSSSTPPQHPAGSSGGAAAAETLQSLLRSPAVNGRASRLDEFLHTNHQPPQPQPRMQSRSLDRITRYAQPAPRASRGSLRRQQQKQQPQGFAFSSPTCADSIMTRSLPPPSAVAMANYAGCPTSRFARRRTRRCPSKRFFQSATSVTMETSTLMTTSLHSDLSTGTAKRTIDSLATPKAFKVKLQDFDGGSPDGVRPNPANCPAEPAAPSHRQPLPPPPRSRGPCWAGWARMKTRSAAAGSQQPPAKADFDGAEETPAATAAEAPVEARRLRARRQPHRWRHSQVSNRLPRRTKRRRRFDIGEPQLLEAQQPGEAGNRLGTRAPPPSSQVVTFAESSLPKRLAGFSGASVTAAAPNSSASAVSTSAAAPAPELLPAAEPAAASSPVAAQPTGPAEDSDGIASPSATADAEEAGAPVLRSGAAAPTPPGNSTARSDRWPLGRPEAALTPVPRLSVHLKAAAAAKASVAGAAASRDSTGATAAATSPTERSSLIMISAALRSAQVLAAGMTAPSAWRPHRQWRRRAASDDTAADGGRVQRRRRYFLLLAEREEQRIRADTDWIEACLDDESWALSGILRVSAGKAACCSTRELAQFRGLCEDNMANGVTQYCDLNGFWAICCLQLQDIGRMLAHVQADPRLPVPAGAASAAFASGTAAATGAAAEAKAVQSSTQTAAADSSSRRSSQPWRSVSVESVSLS
uniref:RING-type domain-containing protein n=1 Tax=Macrostomum lignano TaxID=282301 RepID=A0A1I8F2M4_9PLAT